MRDSETVGSVEVEGFQVLIRRARDGDRGAMDRVLKVLRPYLLFLARPYADPSRPAESTSDLLQECCLRAWRKLGTFQGGENDEETFAMFRSWMAQILRRTAMNARRDGGAKSRIPPEKIEPLPNEGGGHAGADGVFGLPASGPTPSAAIRAAEMLEQIRATLKRLPDRTAARIVWMRFFDGLTIDRISERVGLSPVRVRERYRSAVKRLRHDLGELLSEWL